MGRCRSKKSRPESVAMSPRLTRIRLFAGCALFALAFPSVAFAQPAGRVPVAPGAQVARQAAAPDITPVASDDAPHVAARPAPAAPHGPLRLAQLPPAAQHFFAAVRANFAQWDLNHDGRLTREEIELDMQNPRITGEAAAALAALKIGSTKFNNLPDTRVYSAADIDDMEETLRENHKLDANFIAYFVVGFKKLQDTPRELFAQGLPHLTSMRQFFTTDCYFLSAAGAVAETNPQALVRLITANRDGSYAVRFPGRAPVRVTAPTDAEIAAYTAAKDGLWLSVLEKAYAVVRIQMEPKEAKTREPLDSVGFRFGSTNVMELFTGHASRAIRLAEDSDKGVTGPMMAQVRAALRTAFRDHRAVTASMSHHAYAITAYDEAADLVTIHNPYNMGGFETLTEGKKIERNGEGFFTISTAQLATHFFYVRVEQGGRASS
jgi:hypothetical protein